MISTSTTSSRINTFGIKATDFEKGMEKMLDLYISGYNSIRQYFYQRFDFYYKYA